MKQALYIGVVLCAVLLAGCSANEETRAQTKSNEASKVLANEQTKESVPVPTNAVVETKRPLPLTQEQKKEYHKQYEEIVNQANETKIGNNLGVPSIAEFEPEDWADPQEYEQRIQEHIDSFLASEQKALSNLSSPTTEAVKGSAGEMKKTTHLYIEDKIFSVEVSGEFETQLKKSRNGQVFSNVNQITSQIASSSNGEWKQTFSDASLIDHGRTYSLLIEGVYTFLGIATEKAFTIEFSCDEYGNIR